MQVKISTRAVLVFLMVLSLLSAIIFSISLLINSRQQTANSIGKQHQYNALADQLEQTSDDLTRMARSYVITGDMVYKENYYRILNIRDGVIPRPILFKPSFWNFVTTQKDATPTQGTGTSFIALLQQAGITDEELKVLEQSKNQSDNLTHIEKTAFSALEGLYADELGNFTIRRTPDPKYAREILYDADYHTAKADIMRPLKEFQALLDSRIRQNVSKDISQEDFFWKVTIFFVLVTIFFCIWVFIHFRTRVLKPIIKLSQITQGIISGEMSKRASVTLNDEIGTLNAAFNEMIEERIKAEFELKKSEQGLRTTLNSIGDAMIATDIYGNVVRMNPVAEKLCGWIIEDAIHKPLDDIFNIINTTTRKPVSNPVSSVLKTRKTIGLNNHTILVSKGGEERQIADSAAPIRDDDGDVTGVVLVFRDVSEEYAVQESLYKSEERFKRLFENAQVAMCNEDLSAIVEALDNLRETGITNLREYLENDVDAVKELVDLVKVTQVNGAMLRLFDADKITDFFGSIRDTFGTGALEVFIDELCAIWDKKRIFRSEANFITPMGKYINAIISFQIPEKKEDFKSIPISIMDISDLKKTEVDLRQSEERYKRLFENAEVAIINEDLSGIKIALEKIRENGVTDIHSYLTNNSNVVLEFINKVRILHVNRATLELFGATDNADFIHDFDKNFGPNAYDVFLNGICAMWNKDKLYRAIADFKTIDGRAINAIISYPIPETIEGFKNIPVSIIDITELKNTENAYRESEERLSLHIERTPLGIISWDKDFNCIQWNPAAENIFGFSQKDAMGKQAIDFISHESLKGEIDEISMVLKNTRKGSHTINKNITKDGRNIICEWFNAPLIDSNGDFIGAASMVQDITKHKENEDELRKLSQAVEQSPASILITDTSGAIEYVNPRFEKSSGYSSSEVMGKNPRFLQSGHTTKEDYSNLWNVIRAGREWQGEFHNKRKDGSLYWESASISPITGEDGEITHFLASRVDITEHKQLEGHLQRSHKMEAVGELAGGIAHDFNNLLGIIIGNLDLMKRRVEGNEKLLSQLEKAQKAALRGSTLTRRLLNFSHQSPEASSPVNINKIILSLEELIGRSLTQKITLVTNLADDLWKINLNTGDFEDMLINLSLNARDAMLGRGKLIIETKNIVLDQPIGPDDEMFRAGDYIEIIVSDTGTGMSKETTAKIFDPFFTTKTKDKGTGLGLSMVYGFIQRSKGHISVYSEQGVGTTFKIYLPRSINEPDPIKIPKKKAPQLPRGHETILIVDDEKELVVIAKHMLDDLGYKTICCYNADEALGVLKKNNDINLLFSDVVMPGTLNGFDLADRAIELYPKIKILLTSGFTGKMQDPEIAQKWGRKILAKPYHKADIANRIRIILDDPL